MTEGGFEMLCGGLMNATAIDVAVQALVTTQYQNLKRLEANLHWFNYSIIKIVQQLYYYYIQHIILYIPTYKQFCIQKNNYN